MLFVMVFFLRFSFIQFYYEQRGGSQELRNPIGRASPVPWSLITAAYRRRRGGNKNLMR